MELVLIDFKGIGFNGFIYGFMGLLNGFMFYGFNLVTLWVSFFVIIMNDIELSHIRT